MSDALVTAELQDVDGVDVDRVPACGHAHELTSVGADERDPCDHFVAVLEQVVNVDAEVGDGRKHHLEQLPGRVPGVAHPRDLLMFDEVLRHVLVDDRIDVCASSHGAEHLLR